MGPGGRSHEQAGVCAVCTSQQRQGRAHVLFLLTCWFVGQKGSDGDLKAVIRQSSNMESCFVSHQACSSLRWPRSCTCRFTQSEIFTQPKLPAGRQSFWCWGRRQEVGFAEFTALSLPCVEKKKGKLKGCGPRLRNTASERMDIHLGVSEMCL